MIVIEYFLNGFSQGSLRYSNSPQIVKGLWPSTSALFPLSFCM